MPPEESASHFADADRHHMLAELDQALLAAQGDNPGPNMIRRLTSAEYDYCIEDLTGLELSAARRIQDIYRRYGFRAAGGEGAEPCGLNRFARAFQVAWQFQHRQALGWSEHSLDDLARRANLEPRFANHIVAVLQQSPAPFPLSDIIARFQQFPTPEQLRHGGLTNDEQQQQRIAHLARQLYAQVQNWQNRLAGSASAEEEAAVLAGGPLQIPDKAHFVARATRLRKSRSKEFTPDLNNASRYGHCWIHRPPLLCASARLRRERRLALTSS